jgi:hypothetical protein
METTGSQRIAARERGRVPRRDFIEVCTAAAAAQGRPALENAGDREVAPNAPR